MENLITAASLELFLQKLTSIKNKIQLQKTIAESLLVEIDALKLDCSLLSQTSDAADQTIGVLHSSSDPIRSIIDVVRQTIDTGHSTVDVLNKLIDTEYLTIDALHKTIDTAPQPADVLYKTIDVPKQVSDTAKPTVDTTESINDTVKITELLIKHISKAAKEKINRAFYFPYIPKRMAKILIALEKNEKLKEVEIEKLSNASRNTVMRSLAMLKKLGWTKFHGSGSGGYYFLTEEGKNLIREIDHG